MPFTDPRDWTTGEFVTEAMLDSHVRDQFRYLWEQRKVKTADQTRTDTTLTNDTVLFFPVGATENWVVNTDLLIDSNPTANIKCTWTISGGGSIKWAPLGIGTAGRTWVVDTANSSTVLANATEVLIFSSPAAATIWGASMKCLVTTGSAGTVQFQFAQNSASGSTIVKAGSTMIAKRIVA